MSELALVGLFGNSNYPGAHRPVNYEYTDWVEMPKPNPPGNSSDASPSGLTNEGTQANNPYGVNPPVTGLVPLLYSLGLGNESWRSNNSDIVSYLSGRESIRDVLHSNNVSQRRVVAIGGNNYAYVLHTNDEAPDGSHPSHVIGMLTAPVNSNNVISGSNGAKFTQYSFWPAIPSGNGNDCPTISGSSANSYTQPTGSGQQFEFYNYPTNGAELGNEYVSDSGNSANYATALASVTPGEIYSIATQFSSAYSAAFCNYWNYIQTAGAGAADDMLFLL